MRDCQHRQLARSCNISELEKELSNLRTLIAKERDEFGKKEAELKAKLFKEREVAHGMVDRLSRANNELQDKLSVYDKALKDSQTMTSELLRTMDDGHWYADDLKALSLTIKQALSSGAKAEVKNDESK